MARLGYGAGEQVAEGLWADARELLEPVPRRRRARAAAAHAGLATLLTGRRDALATEELAPADQEAVASALAGSRRRSERGRRRWSPRAV